MYILMTLRGIGPVVVSLTPVCTEGGKNKRRPDYTAGQTADTFTQPPPK